ncbi:hypothetical protein EVAR_97574_1 [Eumeta japonica]|uniref:Uncharacterized protein n=1 Tax=Eumeta variegata TaxID=151549 RepID=A0A4C1WQ47_EUMVA|nr:hypothetical protein EVAR_97574_1 [Eumeta japonica]
MNEDRWPQLVAGGPRSIFLAIGEAEGTSDIYLQRGRKPFQRKKRKNHRTRESGLAASICEAWAGDIFSAPDLKSRIRLDPT